MADRVPQRLVTAVEAMDVAPDARVLELGCGVGFAAVLVCRRLTDGHLTALDRSAIAIEQAERRLAGFLDDGRADLQHRALADFHGDGRPYDVIFAVNVNVFWLGEAAAEVGRIRELVADDGIVHLFYEMPGGVSDRAETRSRTALEHGGFTVESRHLGDLLWVTGRPGSA